MPMLMTDVAKGAQAAVDIQKAELQTASNPVINDEVIKQAPLETQKLQQSLQINDANLKKNQICDLKGRVHFHTQYINKCLLHSDSNIHSKMDVLFLFLV